MVYFLSIICPFLGAFAVNMFARFVDRDQALYICIMSMFLTFSCTVLGAYDVLFNHRVCVLEGPAWISSGNLDLRWGFLFDSISCMMLVTVGLVSLLVHLYSLEYMRYDPALIRFMNYLSLFTFAMFMFISADNFIQMFLGWEGVGLCSYLLINFWHTRGFANTSAIKAVIVNRIGDCALLLAILTIFYFYQSLDYSVVFMMTPSFMDLTVNLFGFSIRSVDLICFFLMVGAMGKSAQIILHTWLPDAMEGPTPVSALIHAATMVTAGIFLIIRCSYLFEYSPVMLSFMGVVGAMTAFFAASCGLFQNDLKKIIAYSTCSQLGYMVFICSCSAYHVGLFHLINHAFFKALLFLSAGSVIHVVAGEQDVRKMGGLYHYLPYTYASFLIGSLALIGFPFLTGFYSKDLILEIAYSGYSIPHSFLSCFLTIAVCFTTFYSTRLLFLTFFGYPNGYRVVYEHLHENSIIICIPLYILAIGSIFWGYFSQDLVVGLGTDVYGTAIFILPEHNVHFPAEFLHYTYKLIPFFSSMGSLLFTWLFYYYSETIILKFEAAFRLVIASTITLKYSIMSYFDKANVYNVCLRFFKNFYLFLNKKWYFDFFYNNVVARGALYFGYDIVYKTLDRGFIEILGPLSSVRLLSFLSRDFHKYQTGNLLDYVFAMFSGVFLLLLAFFVLYL